MEEAVTCSSCGGQDHRRRTYRDCPMNQHAPLRINMRPMEDQHARSNVAVEVVRCASCEGEDHKRRTHRNYPLNPINAADAATAPEDVHCPFCNRVGHNTTNHWNCARNPLSSEDDCIACNHPDLSEVARQSIGSMDVTCSSCGAFMWIGERKIRFSVSSPVFRMRCVEEEALLAPLRPLPTTIVDLLTRNDAIGREFKQSIQSYNSALSFTSMNANLDRRYANEKHGAYAFRIHRSHKQPIS